MHRCRILLDREKLHSAGHPPCHSFIPVRIGDEGVSMRIVTCNMQDDHTGCSLLRISDASDSLVPGHIVTDVGDCPLIKSRQGQYLALVTNRACPLAMVVSGSGCILTSAYPRTDSLIEWTLIGPTSGRIHDLLRTMREEGYEFKLVSSEAVRDMPVLSPKQDLYFTTAWEAGYYDIPKRISLDELAENLGCCKSTLNVTLRAAERNVFELYMAANKSSESSERV